jgi:hypothetical protein
MEQEFDLKWRVGARALTSGREAFWALAALAELFTVGDRLDRCPYHDCPSTPILLSYTPDTINYGCSKYHYWDIPREYGKRLGQLDSPAVVGHA